MSWCNFSCAKRQTAVIYSFQEREHLKNETIPESQWHLSTYRKRTDVLKFEHKTPVQIMALQTYMTQGLGFLSAP